MAITSISPYVSVQHFSPVCMQADKDTLLTRLVEKIVFAEEQFRVFVREHPFVEVLKNRALRIEGCVRIAGGVFLVVDFIKHICALRSVACSNLSEEENRSKLVAEVKETFVSLVTLSSVTASLLKWADAVHILVLGKLVPFLQKFVYGASLITSGFGIEKTIHMLKKEDIALAEEQNPAARELHRHRYNLAILDLAYHISTIAWAILGLTELVGSLALSSLLSGPLLMISCGLVLASLVYSLYIEFKIAPLAAPPAVNEIPAPEQARARDQIPTSDEALVGEMA